MRVSRTQKQLAYMPEHSCGYWIELVRKQTLLKAFKNYFNVQLSVFAKNFDYATEMR